MKKKICDLCGTEITKSNDAIRTQTRNHFQLDTIQSPDLRIKFNVSLEIAGNEWPDLCRSCVYSELIQALRAELARIYGFGKFFA